MPWTFGFVGPPYIGNTAQSVTPPATEIKERRSIERRSISPRPIWSQLRLLTLATRIRGIVRAGIRFGYASQPRLTATDTTLSWEEQRGQVAGTGFLTRSPRSLATVPIVESSGPLLWRFSG